MVHFTSLAASALLALVTCVAAHAQTYPTKPVRIVVPFPAGGPLDTIGRAIAPRLSESLGQPVLVDNRPGAATIIGAEHVARSAPDGYTIMLTADATISVNPLLYSKLPYSQADFAPVTMVANVPEFLMVNSNLPANSIRELIALAKAQPGKLNYGSFGLGSNGHLEGEAFKAATGSDIVHVPFKGAAEVIPAMVSGQIEIVFTGATQALPHIKSGRIKALGVQARERSPLLPNVPTFAEAGLQGFDSKVWFGVLAPAKTPQDIVRRLSAEIDRIVGTAEFRDKYILGLSIEPAPAGPEAFAAAIQQDREKYGRFVKAANVKLD